MLESLVTILLASIFSTLFILDTRLSSIEWLMHVQHAWMHKDLQNELITSGRSCAFYISRYISWTILAIMWTTLFLRHLTPPILIATVSGVAILTNIWLILYYESRKLPKTYRQYQAINEPPALFKNSEPNPKP